MGLTLRQTKGSSLTFAELDANFTYLSSSLANSLSPTGSFTGSFTGVLNGTASFALSASLLTDIQNLRSGSALFTGSIIITGSISSTQGFTGSLLGTASRATTASYSNLSLSSSYSSTSSISLGNYVITPSNSIIIPTINSIPNWAGTEGELKPVVSGSLIALYAYMSGSWNQFIPAPRTFSIQLSQSQITASLFSPGITITPTQLGLTTGKGARFYRDLTTVTYNPFGAAWTATGNLNIKTTAGGTIINTISQGELTLTTLTTNAMLESGPYRIADANGIYLESSSPITASATSSYLRVNLVYDIIDVSV